MLTRRLSLAALMAAPFGSAFAQGTAQGPAWPDRVVSFTIPFPAGGSADLLARLVADRMAPLLGAGARMVVENRAGAGGTIGSDHVKRQPADGHAILLGTPSTHGTVPALQPDTTPYDPIADFTAIAILGRAPIALAVPANSPHRDPQSLIAWLRANPGKGSWGSSGSGSVGHLAGELMALSAGGVQAEHIPYRGGAPLVEALTKAEVQYGWEPLGSLAAGARDGLFRLIGMGSPTRHPLFPEVATMQQAGLAGFEASTWNVMLGPKGMPPAIVARLNAAASQVLAMPDVKARLATAGIDAVSDSTPASTAAFVAGEFAKFKDIVARARLNLAR
ncbi:Bug family tripartite tricarboxylate transporter substrate binding protein [Falsiroseomonas selenitidurans]|uniref:Tripartite tricarboxylate transporter substrate binding protein n=1 Tax=Falsiroseomonas selenitidurans TaxID=2716335 RepID=A0ABX1E2P6_9PROT|nr:tripartite tricarboxylate transporter substrate binding protein [Falsiroseomonas selenitidurans]NKC31441.1 tripartite tricarboxylate transporter substrate binding protein [Falsiroseomonas selenitidurans]